MPPYPESQSKLGLYLRRVPAAVHCCRTPGEEGERAGRNSNQYGWGTTPRWSLLEYCLSDDRTECEAFSTLKRAG